MRSGNEFILKSPLRRCLPTSQFVCFHSTKMAVAETDNHGGDEDDDAVKPLPAYKLFRYASCVDVLLIIAASSLSVVAGTAIPLVIMIIGLAATEYLDFIITDARITAAAMNVTLADFFCDRNTTLDNMQSLNLNPENEFQNGLNYLSFGMIAVAIVYFFSLAFSALIWSLIASRQEKRIKINFLHAVLRQDAGYFDIHIATELPSLLISDVSSITKAISSAFGEILFQMSTAVSCLVIALYFDWILALVVNSLVVLLFIVLAVFGKMNVLATAKEQTFLNHAISLAEQVFLSIKTVIAYSGQESEIKRYERHLQNGLYSSHYKSISAAIIFSFFSMLIFSILALGFWYGGQRYISCTGITVGDIIIVVFVTGQLCFSNGYLVIPLDTLNKALAGGAAVFNVIDTKPHIYIEDDNDKLQPETFNGNIQFSGVVFSYPSRPDVQVLHGIDLHIKAGQTIALVGPSGCGKSSIMNLIPRIYDFNGGNILLDGHDISELSVRWLRNQIGIVSQEPDLLNVSIAENIGYGKENATMEEIEAAAETANAHDFILALPDGYNTIVGEGNSQISGGQKQRIAIARALIRNPKILLLDEATSALDTRSEKFVQAALDKARDGRTTIIIAHKLSTIQTADVIVGINEGRVVEMGSHSELLEKQGLYYKLVMNQSDEINQEDKEHKQHRRKSSMFARRKSSIFARRQNKSLRNSVHRHTSLRQRGSQRNFELQNIAEEMDNDTQEKQQQSPLKDLFLVVKPEWWILVPGILFYCLIGLQQTSLYILMSRTLEVFANNDPTIIENDLNFYVYLFIGMGVVGAILYILGSLCVLVGSNLSARRIRVELFKKYLSQDVQFFEKEENAITNLLVNLTESPGYIAELLGTPIGFVIRVLAAVFASVVVSLYGSWVIALIILPSYVILAGSWVFNSRFSNFYMAKYINKILIRSNSMAVEAIENVTTLNNLGIADRITDQYDGLISSSYKHIFILNTVRGFSYGLAESSVIFVLGFALAVSGIIFVTDTSSPFNATYNNIFLALTSILFTGIFVKDAFNSLANFENAKISASEIYHHLSENPKINDTTAGDQIIPESLSADIIATSLFFSYPSHPGVHILNGLSITVKPGHTLALVGPSGSGKSTVVSLLERFYDCNSGDLQLGGVDIRNLNTSWLRQQMSLVSQEPVLFDMSIADNIRYGANFRQVTEQEIQQAAKSANIHDFILSLPEGYNTNVGLKGTQLSGGQKQRIAIARALVRNPKILLLDEATSALDTESEKIVQEALDKAREGRTTIIIAHRLSTIHNADCIAVLYRGKVFELGTHSELMEKKGAYFKMVHA